jgi:UDP-2,4-diacetamido-2,4,6-trideoxy-beta-L-altropyranose hydrolase
LSTSARRLVDGKGAARVVSLLRATKNVQVRCATADDRHLLWEWANDPEVRAASLSMDSISWETHVLWFSEKLSDEQSLLLVAEDESGDSIGQIRFDMRGQDAELHISLAKEKRGAGLAVSAVNAAVVELFARRQCERVHAYVKPENIASQRVFEKAGFTVEGSTTVRNHSVLHFIRKHE